MKYPSTKYHPASSSVERGDKIMQNIEELLYNKEIIVTEKMDGENTSMYYDKIHARSLDSRHHESRSWVKGLWANIRYNLPSNLRIIGENLYAKHSIHYKDLESYFMVFQIWIGDTVLDWDTTILYCEEFNLKTVPVLYEGIYDKKIIEQIVDRMDFERQEGFVIRTREGFSVNNFENNVFKYVRPNHVQTDEHWMNQPIIKNILR